MQANGGASSGGTHNGAGGDTIPKGGAASAGTSGNAHGGASGGGAPSVAGSTSGGSSASGGTGGTGSGGGPAAGGSGGASTVSLKELSDVAAAYCASARTCCPQNSPLTDCEAKAAMHYPTESIQSGAVRVDATALAACRTAYQKAASGCQEIPVVDACRKVFVGTRKTGESCSDGGYDCSAEPGESTCRITTLNGHTGVCKPTPHGKTGEACLYSCRDGDSCGGVTSGPGDSVLTACFESEGLYCAYADNGGTCQPIKKLGDPCTSFDECGTKGYCDTTCKRAGMEGESCGSCRHDLTCTSGTCQGPTFEQANACDGYSLGP